MTGGPSASRLLASISFAASTAAFGRFFNYRMRDDDRELVISLIALACLGRRWAFAVSLLA
jgi:hypothetical protein